MDDNSIVAPIQRRTWAEIDINNIRYNYSVLRDRIDSKVKICCVIKANAYGHGAVKLAHEYERLGADFFAVSNLEEAIELRTNNISLPILILGYTNPNCAKMLFDYNITQCVFSLSYARLLNEEAKSFGCIVKTHLKIDTGMTRLGFSTDSNSLFEILKLRELENLTFEGIFTHFSSADEGELGEEYTRLQIKRFKETVEFLENRGFKFKIKHCSNSAGAVDYPEATFDMVRLGIVLYGCQSELIRNSCNLRYAMTLKTVISSIKCVPCDTYVSYSRTYKTNKETTIATLPIGYADGLWRANSKNGLKVCVNGKPAYVIGKICMDQCMVDISDFNDGLSEGNEVTVFGETDGYTVDDIAKLNGTINYEILCSLGARIPRIYKYN